MKIEIEHEGSCLGATGGTGRLIVRDALAKGHSVVALVRSKARALDLPGSRHDRGRCSIASPTTATSSGPATRAGASRTTPSVPAFQRRPPLRATARRSTSGPVRHHHGPNRPSSIDRHQPQITKMKSSPAAEAAGVVRRAAELRDKVHDRGSWKFGIESTA